LYTSCKLANPVGPNPLDAKRVAGAPSGISTTTPVELYMGKGYTTGTNVVSPKDNSGRLCHLNPSKMKVLKLTVSCCTDKFKLVKPAGVVIAGGSGSGPGMPIDIGEIVLFRALLNWI
jgi:hypothetical protein